MKAHRGRDMLQAGLGCADVPIVLPKLGLDNSFHYLESYSP